MSRRLLRLVFLLGVSSFWGCSSTPEPVPRAVEPDVNPGLFSPALMKAEAPAEFSVLVETTKGAFTVRCNREWAPYGVDRFYNLVKAGYFEDVAFYRAIESYIVQFGTHGNPEVTQIWAEAKIRDDEPQLSNDRGTMSFAQEAPNSRTTQLFINLGDNAADLDSFGLAPICRVVEGMETLDSIYTGYGELQPKGDGPKPNLLQRLGNKYLRREFPEMDYIKDCKLIN